MDIGEFVRSFFGLGGSQHQNHPDFPSPNNFPDEDYDNECDCLGGDSLTGESGHSGSHSFFGRGDQSLDDMFRHFHGDMNRQMDFIQRQMEDMMKGFGVAASDAFPSENRPSIMDRPESPPGDKSHQPPFFHFDFRLPFQSDQEDKKNPRDFMLKGDKEKAPNAEMPASHVGERPIPFFEKPFRRIFPLDQPRQGERKDSDLDGKVSESDVLAFIKKSDEERASPHSHSHGRSFFSGSSVTMTTIRGPDGKIEQKKIVKDSSGREESTVTRSVDGQCHTVTTITGPQGVEERREDFKNMDQKIVNYNTIFDTKHVGTPQNDSHPLSIMFDSTVDIKQAMADKPKHDITTFEGKWGSRIAPQQSPGPVILRTPPNKDASMPRPRLDIRDVDLFSRFFGGPQK